MLRGESLQPESTHRSRRPAPTRSGDLIFALTPPPTSAQTEALWPSWLSPLGASWKRSGEFRSRPTANRSE